MSEFKVGDYVRYVGKHWLPNSVHQIRAVDNSVVHIDLKPGIDWWWQKDAFIPWVPQTGDRCVLRAPPHVEFIYFGHVPSADFIPILGVEPMKISEIQTLLPGLEGTKGVQSPAEILKMSEYQEAIEHCAKMKAIDELIKAKNKTAFATAQTILEIVHRGEDLLDEEELEEQRARKEERRARIKERAELEPARSEKVEAVIAPVDPDEEFWAAHNKSWLERNCPEKCEKLIVTALLSEIELMAKYENIIPVMKNDLSVCKEAYQIFLNSYQSFCVEEKQ